MFNLNAQKVISLIFCLSISCPSFADVPSPQEIHSKKQEDLRLRTINDIEILENHMYYHLVDYPIGVEIGNDFSSGKYYFYTIEAMSYVKNELESKGWSVIETIGDNKYSIVWVIDFKG